MIKTQTQEQIGEWARNPSDACEKALCVKSEDSKNCGIIQSFLYPVILRNTKLQLGCLVHSLKQHLKL